MHAPYASDPTRARGRRVAEEESTFRSCFQRDRDRIIHSSAFRRLKHKTQVFVAHEGDYFRTRLTHSIEVAQVARTIAGALRLNGELTEAVALAHDLGHTPFGHTGEDALAALMAPYGGFDHNAQAIRIVTRLERHYARFDGLNLTWETLEGLAKHNGPVTPLRGDGPVTPLRGDGPVTPLRGDGQVVGELPYALAEYDALHDLELHTHASAEAQVAALADDIAYNNHDLHDGLRAGLFCLPVIRFSPAMWQDLRQIRDFLFARMYRAPQVMAERARVTKVVEELFPLFLAQPDLMPRHWARHIEEAAQDRTTLARMVSDYIAGMTDRFALQEHARLIGTS